MLADSNWPTADDSLIADNIIKIGVQLMASCRTRLAGTRLLQAENRGCGTGITRDSTISWDQTPKRVSLFPIGS